MRTIVNEKTFAYNPARINVGSIGYSYNLNEIIISSLYVCFKTNKELEDLYLLAYVDSHIFNKDILSNHFSFWLDWDESILLKRIRDSKKRPLAFKSIDKKIKAIIKKRTKIYSKAQFKINCNKLTKSEIQKKIIENL